MRKKGTEKSRLRYLSPAVIILWIIALLVVARSIGFFAGMARGGRHPQEKPSMVLYSGKGKERGPGGAAKKSDMIRIAGSGSCIPVTRLLAEKFMEADPDRNVMVFDSIGSTGGVSAVMAGDIDIALVSRPLKQSEKNAASLRVVPLARVAAVVAVNTSAGVRTISRQELKDIFMGTKKAWGNGTPIVVLQREKGDSSHAAIGRVIGEFGRINMEAYRAGKWRVLFKDQQMISALAGTTGAIGITDAGIVRFSESKFIRMLEYENRPPTAGNIEKGTYPFYKDLSFVVIGDAGDERVGAFLDFVRTDAAQEALLTMGYIPVQPGHAGAGN
ncbi:MAG: substrate-binding domain-containing protein [Pseudomonadota bacterium]